METKLEYLLDSGNTMRFRNIRMRHFRKMGIFILKCTAYDLTYSALQYWEQYFFRSLSALKLVNFSDLLGLNYAYFCL